MSHHVRKTVASVFIASMALALTPFIAQASPGAVPGSTSPANISSTANMDNGEQRYIVKYNNEANAEAQSQSLAEKGIEVKDTLSHAIKASVVVATPAEIESVKKSEAVVSVVPDTKVSLTGATSNWDLDRIDQRTGRDGQYNVGAEGAGVDIYIVDTGINFSHTEFTGRITDSFFNINDGHGANDCNGHGTHVAGTAAGTTYGVAKRANIIPVRVLECDGSGWSSTVMAGIDWAIARHVAGQPAVMNMSIGGFTNSEFDQTVQSAINDGITVIAAAGNDGADACNSSPARVPAAITVAATDINDSQASWSNYGSCVDVQAPGVYIKSAWINGNTAYNFLDGTSMATPHVTGAAAVMLSRDPSLTPARLAQQITMSATNDVVRNNKGATPNRFLYLPPTPLQHSCANLKPGDAWAGVGSHCGLGGSGSTSSLSGANPTSSATGTSPASAAVEAPATNTQETPAPAPTEIPVAAPAAPAVTPEPVATTPAPAPVPAQQEPVKVHIPEQAQIAPAAAVPAVSNEPQKTPVAAPAPVAPAVVVAAPATEPQKDSSPVSAPVVAEVPVSAPVAPSTSEMPTVAPAGDQLEQTAANVPSKAEDGIAPLWVITVGALLLLVIIAVAAFLIRKNKAS